MTPAERLRPLIEAAARSYRLDPDLLEAVVWKESDYRADAFRFEPVFWERYLKSRRDYANAEPRRVSSSYGLVQVMYSTAVEHGFNREPEYLFLVGVNLDMGAKILAGLLKVEGGDPAKALEAYNGGRGNVDGQGPDARYALDVLKRYRAIRLARDGRS